MRLRDLLVALPCHEVLLDSDVEVTGVVQDSRAVLPGFVFVAIRGREADGHQYIADALRRGAAAVVAERAEGVPAGVPGVVVRDGRAALARLAAAFHGFPSRRLKVIGVTGTDGKTTTASLILALLKAAGRPAGAITTVAATIDGRELDTGFHTTTPDAPAVQSYLAQMVAAEAEYAIVESTSHGLDQGRTLECDYDVAVITNVTAEHLDYHQSYEAYLAAKARLFEMLSAGYRKPGVPKVSVLNADDPSVDALRRFPADRLLTYGLDSPADVLGTRLELGPTRTRFVAETPAGSLVVETRLLGRHNVSNALAAIAVAVSQGLPLATIERSLSDFRGVVGRMEAVDEGQDFQVIVDFAHTPNALQQALTVARSLAQDRVIAVFGCAGLRDRRKRPVMGAVAGRLADLVVLTAEDPRTEDVEAIIEEIASGCRQVGRRLGVDYWAVPSREQAIARAFEMARPGDLVLITGKGHEKSMCFGTVETPWSDHETARRLLQPLRKLSS